MYDLNLRRNDCLPRVSEAKVVRMKMGFACATGMIYIHLIALFVQRVGRAPFQELLPPELFTPHLSVEYRALHMYSPISMRCVLFIH